jgi:hypothetical protein
MPDGEGKDTVLVVDKVRRIHLERLGQLALRMTGGSCWCYSPFIRVCGLTSSAAASLRIVSKRGAVCCFSRFTTVDRRLADGRILPGPGLAAPALTLAPRPVALSPPPLCPVGGA